MKYLNKSEQEWVLRLQEQYRTIIGKELDSLTNKHIADAVTGIIGRKNGLILSGSVGGGKTTLMKALHYALDLAHKEYIPEEGQLRKYYSHKWVTAKDVAHIKHRDQIVEMANVSYLYIDDIGEEPVQMNLFGNEIQPMVDLLELRYNNGNHTFITTNLNYKQISEKYGARIADRIVEMCHPVKYEHPKSYRV